MSLIDYTYFIGQVNLPGLQNSDNKAVLNLFIAKYEPEYLQSALGYSLWKLFNAGIAQTEGRWFDLKNGVEYNGPIQCESRVVVTDASQLMVKKWNGFTNSGKVSAIADYVYYWFMRDNVSFTSTLGESSATSENTKSVSPNFKIRGAWREMVDLTKSLHEYLLYAVDGENKPLYPEFDYKQIKEFKHLPFF